MESSHFDTPEGSKVERKCPFCPHPHPSPSWYQDSTPPRSPRDDFQPFQPPRFQILYLDTSLLILSITSCVSHRPHEERGEVVVRKHNLSIGGSRGVRSAREGAGLYGGEVGGGLGAKREVPVALGPEPLASRLTLVSCSQPTHLGSLPGPSFAERASGA